MVRLFLFLGLCLCYSWPTGVPAPAVRVKKILVGVDGVSREEFDHAQKKLGLFSKLRFVKTHVSTFPSISDYSWNVMVGAKSVHGKRGRIRTYEAAHFDRERNEIVSDPREYFRRLGEEQHYFSGAFEHWLNPFIESLLYIPTEELPRLELKQLLTAVKEDQRDLVTVMVASSDALAHTRSDGSKFLVELDKFICDIEEHYRTRKVPVEIILASDHGQAARFSPGENPLPLKPVKISGSLKAAGLRSSKKLGRQGDVVIPVMALANYGTAYFFNGEDRDSFIAAMRKENWFSIGMFRKDLSPEKMKIYIFDQKGEAHLTVTRNRNYQYFYEPVSGNPLEIPVKFHGKWLDDAEARALTTETSFPDSLYRIAFSSFEEEAEFPDLLFTLKDEFYLAGDLDSWTTMYQTHGSLGIRSSSGIVASTHELRGQEFLRTNEVLQSAGITPQEMFGSTSQKDLPAEKGKIATGSENWDNRRIFSLMNRAVQDSRYVFEEKSFDAIMGVIRPLVNKKSSGLNGGTWKEALTLADVAHVVDLLIRNGSVDTVKTDPRVREIQARLAHSAPSAERSPSAETSWISGDLISKADAAKKIAMKSYSSMFLLEKAMTIPEVPFVTDERKSPEEVKNPDEVFAEIFRERSLAEELFPTRFPLHWDPVLPPEDVTLVYIPGIYNSLFDDELFRNGLDHLKNKWGVRVISPKVYSTCSSAVNGDLIMKELERDYDHQLSLGRKGPSYFILGYSKGGVDALHAFTRNKEFVSRHVHGLLTVASPVRGTSILDKADLPPEVMQIFGAETAPEECRKKETASASISPTGAQSFLKKNAPELIGLTRYFSLSFVSDLRSSHLFMRATKNIARFGEPNDGVVTLSSSRFPAEFGATDFGQVNADHLAGIVASHFPHKAFLESVLFSLARAEAFHPEKNHIRNEATMYQAKNISPDRHKQTLHKMVGSLSEKAFGSSDLSQLSEDIRGRLSKSCYALKPFSFIRRNKVVHVSFREGRWPASHNGSLVPVHSVEELHDLFLTTLQSSGKNLLKSSRMDVPESHRETASPPYNELGYHEDLRLNLRDLEKFISGKKVSPVSFASHPQGISFVYDHGSSAEFRNEFQLSFEDSAPADADDHPVSGWETIIQDKKVWAKLSSTGSSIRLTSYSWRFLAADYPELDLEIQVNDDVEGANVLHGGTGKDDSAFQLWFTFRILGEDTNREYLSADEKMMTIGYYFGDEIPGVPLELNAIYKNYYSEKDFVVARLPAAHQKLIGLGKKMMGKALLTSHNLIEDIRKAYPGIDPYKAEIVAITIQHDSNDTRGKSEALFRSLSLRPAVNRTVKAD